MSSYSEAGVDVAAADRFASSIASAVTGTWSDDVVTAFGGFAAGITIPAGFTEPVIMMTTDGVGTKIEIARHLGAFDGLGADVVAMCVDDLAAAGATPAGFTDYLAVGALDESRDHAIVSSIAAACEAAGCALLGGETAVHPGTMAPDQFDLAGAAVGVVERASLFDPAAVSAGDVVVGVASPNLRCNGFSLVRSIFDDFDQPFGAATLGATLLEPAVIYAPAVLAVAATQPILAMAHVTGGGLPANLGRVLPEGLTARIDTAAWQPPPIFELIASNGPVDRSEMFGTFNMGIGFAMIVSPTEVDSTVAALHDHGHHASRIGEVVAGSEVVIA